MGGMPGDTTLGIQRCLPPAPSTTQLQPHTGRVDAHSYPTDGWPRSWWDPTPRGLGNRNPAKSWASNLHRGLGLQKWGVGTGRGLQSCLHHPLRPTLPTACTPRAAASGLLWGAC